VSDALFHSLDLLEASRPLGFVCNLRCHPPLVLSLIITLSDMKMGWASIGRHILYSETGNEINPNNISPHNSQCPPNNTSSIAFS
jgi:hypothetical protein